VLSWSSAAGVGEELLAPARERAAVLAEVQAEDAQRDRFLSEAANALREAWQRGDPEALDTAIEHARAAGVSQEMLSMAQRRLLVLEQQCSIRREVTLQAGRARVAAASLRSAREQAAMDLNDAEQAAERARLDKERLEDAAKRQHLCVEASRSLHFAMVQGTAEALTSAIDEATRLGVSREVVARAKRKLARVQTACSPLLAR